MTKAFEGDIDIIIYGKILQFVIHATEKLKYWNGLLLRMP